MPRRRLLVSALLSALLAASAKGAAAQTREAGTPEAIALPAGAARLVPLEVTVNGAGRGNWMLMEYAGELYAPADAFDDWRMAMPRDARTVAYQNRTWVRLAAIPGFAAQWNAANQSVELRFNPAEFVPTRMQLKMSESLTLSPAMTAAFVNYDVSRTTTGGAGSPRANELGALLEFGVTGSLGVLTSSHVGRNLDGGDRANWRRLETTFTRDFPQANTTLRLGDAATRGGIAGRANYFGGVQLARNFALSPGLVTQGIPVIAGQSAAPSTVDLYVNDALRQTAQVPAGPFTFENLPALGGSGQVRMVVRDLLGRETVIEQSFLGNADLLKEGLADWSIEAGALRSNLGIDNAGYGPRFASGLWRYGWDPGLTLEARAESGARTRGATAGITLALPGEVLGQFAASASSHEGDAATLRGRQWIAGAQRWGVRHGFSVRGEFASRDFRQLGFAEGQPGTRSQVSASYSYAGAPLGNFMLAYARSERFGESGLGSLTASFTLPLGPNSAVTLSASRVSGAVRANSVTLSLALPLGDHGSYQANAAARAGRKEAYVSASEPLAQDIGWGWRLLGRAASDHPGGEAGLYYQGGSGLLTADMSRANRFEYLRLGAQGGLVFAGGSVFAARRIQDSFALVEVPGYADVGVGFQGSVQARTNASGQALLTRLQAYRQNGIRLDPNELPISAELDSIEQTVVPAWRGGVKAAFPVRVGRGALIRFVLDDGEPAPAGAEVAIAGDDKTFFVARRGEAFVTGLKSANELVLDWNAQRCRMRVDLPPGNDAELARVGPIACGGVAR